MDEFPCRPQRPSLYDFGLPDLWNLKWERTRSLIMDEFPCRPQRPSLYDFGLPNLGNLKWERTRSQASDYPIPCWQDPTRFPKTSVMPSSSSSSRSGWSQRQLPKFGCALSP
ncbi:OLC1v1019005C1 [Oldenlandia corymbosa var. corymbosa]|uniref:OLC1v1019005C1 n=1 Tax=Oldenlandia corymbosa var. corymbosa TaxID=529605 RepID=A0AAV1ED51_OLDCO|nr:OLC1v1019005C1 [Oldenlandia corymbosa var. corymbosa]